MLRHEEKKKPAGVPLAVPEMEEVAIAVDGGYTPDSAEVDARDGPRTNTPGLDSAFPINSGSSRIGALPAVDCAPPSPTPRRWFQARSSPSATRKPCVGRWSSCGSQARIGDRIDIGVEYVGQNPRGVTMAVQDATCEVRRVGPGKHGIFTALYLRESAKQPAMPFKTLIMASTATEGIACLTLRSATAEYTVRLKEPIEEQDDFVWLPYEVLERRAADRPAQDGRSAQRDRTQARR